MASADLKRELECSICLHLYTNPVTLRCGHNFCWDCIDQILNTQDGAGVYSCPECRAQFQERPALQKNTTLCKLVENFQITQPHSSETNIWCTYCVDCPVPAVKSCLHCEASLCDKHLRFHSKSAEHVLTEATTSLKNRKCSIHKKILEYYCTNDATCICVSCCLIGEHQGHEIRSLDEASEMEKKRLRNILKKMITKRGETEERVWSLEDRWRKAQVKADGKAESVTALFIDIRRRLDDVEKRIMSELSRQEEQVSLSLSSLIQNLEINMEELSRNMKYIEEMCNTIDPLIFLQEVDTGNLCDPEEEEGDEGTLSHDGGDWGAELISRISQTLSDIITDINVTFVAEGPADILMDVNTAADNIHISDDLKTVSRTLMNQNRQETALKFQENQVISRNSFSSGRQYWDVEISGSLLWRVGVCYPSIGRKRRRSYIGNNNKSWCLCGGRQIYNNQCSVLHNSQAIQLPHQISSDKVRIYVDYGAGKLSFYELCAPIRFLYTFTTTFTEPLHAAFCVHKGYVKIAGEDADVGEDCHIYDSVSLGC